MNAEPRWLRRMAVTGMRPCPEIGSKGRARPRPDGFWEAGVVGPRGGFLVLGRRRTLVDAIVAARVELGQVLEPAEGASA